MKTPGSYEDEIIAIAGEFYGAAPRLTRLTSNNNVVCRLDFEAGLPPKVIKMAGKSDRAAASVRREQQALRALAAQGLEVPAVEYTQDNFAGAFRPFFIMPLLPGQTLESACKAPAPPAWARDACRWAGRFVQRIGAAPPGALPGLLPANEHQAFVAYTRERFANEQMLGPPFSEIIAQAAHLVARPPTQVIHGDYAWNQVITDGQRFAVIDWESFTLGHPLDMLGRAIAMIREYGGGQEHMDWFVEGYAGGRALTESERRELHAWEMWHHVGCMGWKFVCGPEHRAHAFAMAERVRRWACV